MAPHDRDISTATATERTALLATKDIAPTADPVVASAAASDIHDDTTEEDESDDGPPLPKWQIFWLCFARVVEPMAFFSIFPYINQMAQENGNLADADVGFYSGLIESLFSLTQALVMIFWGRAADRFGRKPVLVFSLIGVSIALSIFGMAKTIGQMIFFRCLAGVFAGTIVTIRTMLTELSTSRTQAVAFSWFAFSGNLGIFLGPLLGGALADPAHQYPRAFGHIQFFLDYPYALSSFVVSLLGFVGAVTAACFVRETLPKTASTTPAILVEEEADNGNTIRKPDDDQSLSIKGILKSPGVGLVLYVYAYIMLLAFAYTAIVPVFWFTPVSLGGYGFTPSQISLLLSINGASQALWLLLVYPRLDRKIGTTAVLRSCALAYPIFFALCPLGNTLLRHGATTAFWIITPPLLALASGVAMSFTAIQLALNNVAPPDPWVLGTLNSMALTGVSVVRAFAPASFTSLFAWGANTQWLSGYAIWVLMVAMALWFTVVSWWLPDTRARKLATTAAARQGEREGD